jgi:hypothetical protein
MQGEVSAVDGTGTVTAHLARAISALRQELMPSDPREAHQ